MVTRNSRDLASHSGGRLCRLTASHSAAGATGSWRGRGDLDLISGRGRALANRRSGARPPATPLLGRWRATVRASKPIHPAGLLHLGRAYRSLLPAQGDAGERKAGPTCRRGSGLAVARQPEN